MSDECSMTLEIVESFAAIQAPVHCLAGGGGELADQFGVVGMAAGTFNGFFAEHVCGAELLNGIGWGDAESF